MASIKAPIHVLVEAATEAANDAEATVNGLTLRMTEHSSEIDAYKLILDRLSGDARLEVVEIIVADGQALQRQAAFQTAAFEKLQGFLDQLLHHVGARTQELDVPAHLEDLITPYLPHPVAAGSLPEGLGPLSQISPELAEIFGRANVVSIK